MKYLILSLFFIVILIKVVFFSSNKESIEENNKTSEMNAKESQDLDEKKEGILKELTQDKKTKSGNIEKNIIKQSNSLEILLTNPNSLSFKELTEKFDDIIGYESIKEKPMLRELAIKNIYKIDKAIHNEQINKDMNLHAAKLFEAYIYLTENYFEDLEAVYNNIETEEVKFAFASTYLEADFEKAKEFMNNLKKEKRLPPSISVYLELLKNSR